VAEGVRPAFQRALALLNELHPRTTDDAGLWRLPDGERAYAQALAANTTTRMTAEEIHAVGLREVARIEAEMDRVLKTLGRTEGTVRTTAWPRCAASCSHRPRPTRARCCWRAMPTTCAKPSNAPQPLFNITPRAPVEVQRVPALTERTASAYYTTPTPDGTRPGIFWAPLPGPNFNVMGMKSLAVHEAVPGHHFQLALQQEQAGLPRWRQQRIFGGGSAHAEGWALYAERLAIEQGWYEGDPNSLLGALNSQLFRARRLVVDTGLHAKRWTREQAIDYGISRTEVERYVVNPGQACAYMIGMLHILALRDEAKSALGPEVHAAGFPRRGAEDRLGAAGRDLQRAAHRHDAGEAHVQPVPALVLGFGVGGHAALPLLFAIGVHRHLVPHGPAAARRGGRYPHGHGAGDLEAPLAVGVGRQHQGGQRSVPGVDRPALRATGRGGARGRRRTRGGRGRGLHGHAGECRQTTTPMPLARRRPHGPRRWRGR
jgi:hypothetical protein